VTKYNIRQLARCITGLEGERKNFVNMNEWQYVSMFAWD
jgi:hypothetical protein